MTIRLTASGAIELVGTCPVEDAEILLRHLLADPDATVDWSGCNEAHCAVIQVLLLCRRPVNGVPGAAVLRDWIRPLLAGPPH